MIARAIKAIGALFALLVLVTCGMHLKNSGTAPLPERPADSLRVATINVHYIIGQKQTGAWSLADWERRKAPMDAAFKAIAGDLIALQESETFPDTNRGDANLVLDHLLAQNPSYRVAAHGNADVFPPTQPILYNPDRLHLRDQGWFFFSDTPDVIYSRTFNGSWPAFASWAHFEVDGKPLTVINVHFEYSNRSNRLKSAALVAERIAPWLQSETPVLLMGDINALRGSATAQILKDAGLEFAPVTGATYHLNRGVNLFGAIDHLAVSKGVSFASDPVVIRSKFMGEWPTDHYPVVSDVRLD